MISAVTAGAEDAGPVARRDVTCLPWHVCA
jgi:hypothetical protein